MTLQIRVQPRAKRDAVEVGEDGGLRIYVTTAPEGGKANEVVTALIAKRLRVPKRDVTIVRGERSRNKVISVEGLSEGEVRERLGTQGWV